MRFAFDAYQLDDERFVLTGPDGPVHVEPQVFELLVHLVANRARVVTKQELLDTIWGHTFVSESALTSRVKSARRAVGDDGAAQRVIRTVHGRGYQFVAEVRVEGGPDRALPRLRNLPIGRDDDIAGIVERVPEVPLLTLTGPGGMGKTTLALAAAERMAAGYSDGVVFVDLTAVTRQSDVARAVAEAAGVEGSAAASVAGLAAHLAMRPVLLVLDNCEHVLDAAAALVDQTLVHGTTIDLLATSREPLGVGGEHLWPVDVLEGAAPTLFVERARAAEPRIDWKPDDPGVVELCRRLDHVPLAVELAAGQLRRFELAELLARLDDRLGWGLGGGEDDRRHASMEAAIDWSYRLLGPDEQRLLHQLSTFPSTFELVAVEATAPALDGDVVQVFGQLVDKSLVVRDPASGRYRLLESIRAFARDRLRASGESRAALERHRCAVVARVVAGSRLDRWSSATLAASLRADLADVRQAFEASVDRGATTDAVELAVAMSFLWRQTIGVAEGDDWLDRLPAADLALRDELWVQIVRADVGQGRGDHRQMFAAASAASTVDPAVDPTAACLAAHYVALAQVTDPAHAHGALAPARDLAGRSGEPRLVTLVEAFGAVADLAAGEVEAALAAADDLLDGASGDGYERYLLHWVGWMAALAAQDAAMVWDWMGRQQDYLDRTGIGETWLSSYSRSWCVAADGGDIATSLVRALALAEREGYRAEADCLLVVAYAECCAGRFEAAAELVGTAMHERFNATANYVLYRAVIEPLVRGGTTSASLAAAIGRGRRRTAVDALTGHGVVPQVASTNRA